VHRRPEIRGPLYTDRQTRLPLSWPAAFDFLGFSLLVSGNGELSRGASLVKNLFFKMIGYFAQAILSVTLLVNRMKG
jgi:hypothetical protein